MAEIEERGVCIDQLPPEVGKLKFAGSDIPQELARVALLRAQQMPEGVAFYAGRILEASAHGVVKRLGLRPSSKASVNLDLIGSSGCIDDGYLACGHALRRNANDARHLLRQIGVGEQDTIIALLQLWVEWLGHFLRGVSKEVVPAPLSTEWSDATAMIRALVDGSIESLNAWVDPQGQVDNRLLTESTTAAFLCERLTDARHPAADDVTSLCLRTFNREKRFWELRALYLSRNGRAIEAVEQLRQVLGSKYGATAEALGIMGGACKNLWFKDRNSNHIQEARKYYARTPEDGKSSYYLLINAAATSLWLGEGGEARRYAYQAIEELGNYGLTNQWAQSPKANYWIVATMAEAQLIWGKPKIAKELYERARSLDHTGGRWARTQEQLRVHLQFLPQASQVMEPLV